VEKEVVIYQKEEGLAVITINRPEVKNALNLGVFSVLNEVLDKVAADEEVRVIVVKGAGGSFVAGADINELAEHTMMGGWVASRFQQSVFSKLERIGKLSIAAIEGSCLGGGLELALSCTFRVASTTAKLGFPELGLGIIPGFGGTERIVRTVGYAKGSDLLFSHLVIDGEEAHRIGLVHRVAGPGEVLQGAKEWAESLGRLNPVAVRVELELLLRGQDGTIDQSLALESALGALAVSSPEAKELLAKFLTRKT
jgi:enoyl-CoA hydratase